MAVSSGGGLVLWWWVGFGLAPAPHFTLTPLPLSAPHSPVQALGGNMSSAVRAGRAAASGSVCLSPALVTLVLTIPGKGETARRGGAGGERSRLGCGMEAPSHRLPPSCTFSGKGLRLDREKRRKKKGLLEFVEFYWGKVVRLQRGKISMCA